MKKTKSVFESLRSINEASTKDRSKEVKENLLDERWHINATSVLAALGLAAMYKSLSVTRLQGNHYRAVGKFTKVDYDFDSFDDMALDLENYRHKNVDGVTVQSITPGNGKVKLKVSNKDSMLDIILEDTGKYATAYVIEEVSI